MFAASDNEFVGSAYKHMLAVWVWGKNISTNTAAHFGWKLWFYVWNAKDTYAAAHLGGGLRTLSMQKIS